MRYDYGHDNYGGQHGGRHPYYPVSPTHYYPTHHYPMHHYYPMHYYPTHTTYPSHHHHPHHHHHHNPNPRYY
ncbi:hypothetical protein [Lysinibacillus xylanilyticus]|uniref:Uncharacterized protein n=1 Tax=Lysinibacillus xylanilyticus TaxID=582475 RepID=A0A2M9QAJ7_9BACI|nr:hypothetical protein [Lysinibacillus xylanilyticus]PJO45052.1 hypothetical protein CWD94_03225 [Lysinibacillus xylanilyticus]